ncbi:MAG: hypothetical protein M3Q80_01240 [bacterium]|nr:hypothetical protein [bacterium]
MAKSSLQKVMTQTIEFELQRANYELAEALRKDQKIINFQMTCWIDQCITEQQVLLVLQHSMSKENFERGTRKWQAIVTCNTPIHPHAEGTYVPYQARG